jgi:hypothetical protein
LQCECSVNYMWCPAQSPETHGESETGSLCVSGKSSCIACPKGANCTTFGTNLLTANSLEGNWRASRYTTKWHECSADLMSGAQRCDGGGFTLLGNSSDTCDAKSGRRDEFGDCVSDSQCAERQSGLLCSVCDEGSGYRDQFGDCVDCTDQSNRGISIAMLTVIVLVVWGFFYAIKRQANVDPAAVNEAFDSMNMTFTN